MITIHLHDLEFFSFHGIHAEEAVLGNRFMLSMDVMTDISSRVESVDETIDYSVIFEVIKKHMQQPCPLLEQVAAAITEEVHRLSARIVSTSITIRKMNPPISQFRGQVGITYEKSR